MSDTYGQILHIAFYVARVVTVRTAATVRKQAGWLYFMPKGFTLKKGVTRDANGTEVTTATANHAALEQARQAGVCYGLKHTFADTCFSYTAMHKMLTINA